mgnify:CR=1 FL=1
MLRKGQAAMEFLMTYGWAILAAIIAIGVLAYFGVFSPGKFATGTAVVNAPWYANAWRASAASGIVLELKNNGGETLNITSVKVTNCGTNTLSPQKQVIASNQTAVTVTCSPTLSEGGTFKGDVTITYIKEGSSVPLASTGTIAEKVTA